MKFEARSHANCLKTRWIALALVAMILGGHALIAFAQPKQVEPKKTGGYPVRPIRFIVPYAVGGNGDIVSRIVGQRLTESLGQQFVIDNRAGAGGNVGAEAAARAAPNGYTIVLGTNTHAINMSLYAKAGYDLLRDFAPISLVSSAPLVLMVHPSIPASSVKEFIALANASPGKFNYGTGGSGSSAHVTTELFKSLAGVDLVHVPYRGVAQATTELIAGQIHVMFSATSTALAHARAGRTRALAISTARRSALAPELPTIEEAGLKGFDVRIWQGILAPARAPKDIIAQLNGEIGRLLATKEVEEQLNRQGVDAWSSTPEQFGTYLQSEIAKWAKVVKATGARVD
ncbi:MAG: hypothetical protein A3G24_17845 [Betaproteobacteria bacterium RIFCSPLOWO2_12_FULL_62_13]|nr:MAG: hypothetical protein A3G24_17845 [Betaproteobacteria bacterium RIFCSPLOWO2_12_FULL_62_13]